MGVKVDDLTIRYRPLPPGTPAKVADDALARELEAAGCTFIGAAEGGVTANRSAIRTDVYVTRDHDTFVAVAKSRTSCEVEAQTVLSDGAVVATWRVPRTSAPTVVRRILLDAPDGYDLSPVDRETRVEALLEQHRARVRRASTERDALPIDHGAIEGYVSIRHAIAPARAERALYALELANRAAIVTAGMAVVAFLVLMVIGSFIVAVAALLAGATLVYVVGELVRHKAAPWAFRRFHARQKIRVAVATDATPYRGRE